MNIAIWHNLPSGGGKRVLYDQVRGLVERGHTIEIWCPSTADQQFLPVKGLVKENISQINIKFLSNKTRFFKTKGRVKNHSALFFFRMPPEASRLIQRNPMVIIKTITASVNTE